MKVVTIKKLRRSAHAFTGDPWFMSQPFSPLDHLKKRPLVSNSQNGKNSMDAVKRAHMDWNARKGPGLFIVQASPDRTPRKERKLDIKNQVDWEKDYFFRSCESWSKKLSSLWSHTSNGDSCWATEGGDRNGYSEPTEKSPPVERRWRSCKVLFRKPCLLTYSFITIKGVDVLDRVLGFIVWANMFIL